MTTVHAILDDLARWTTDAHDRGDRFERLMAAYPRTNHSGQTWPPRDHSKWGGAYIARTGKSQERCFGIAAPQALSDAPTSCHREKFPELDARFALL